jgi:hypothetical protein
MFLKTLTLSALAAAMATGAMAEPLTFSVSPKGPRIVTVYTSVVDHSKDAILADGTINTEQTFVGVTTPIRIQCDASPNTSVMRTNTFDAAPSSDCP